MDNVEHLTSFLATWTYKPVSYNSHFFLIAETYYLAEPPELFHYLSQSGCVKDRNLDDKKLYDSVMVRC